MTTATTTTTTTTTTTVTMAGTTTMTIIMKLIMSFLLPCLIWHYWEVTGIRPSAMAIWWSVGLYSGRQWLDLEPRMHMTAFLIKANDSLQRIHDMTFEYSASSCSVSLEASLRRNRSQSWPAAPVVENTNGQKEPWSTLRILSSYSSFFRRSCVLKRSLGLMVR